MITPTPPPEAARPTKETDALFGSLRLNSAVDFMNGLNKVAKHARNLERERDEARELGQGQEEPQGQLASEAQKALASLQENPEWNQWVNAIYSEPRFNAPHRMSHVRALEMAALLFLRHAPAAPDAQDGERLDWIEAHGYVLQQYINNAGKTLWLVINEDQRIPADSRILGEAPTLRAALDEARGQKE